LRAVGFHHKWLRWAQKGQVRGFAGCRLPTYRGQSMEDCSFQQHYPSPLVYAASWRLWGVSRQVGGKLEAWKGCRFPNLHSFAPLMQVVALANLRRHASKGLVLSWPGIPSTMHRGQGFCSKSGFLSVRGLSMAGQAIQMRSPCLRKSLVLADLLCQIF